MSLTAICTCGQSYQVKDELAGKKVKCRACGAAIKVEAALTTPDMDDDDLPMAPVVISPLKEKKKKRPVDSASPAATGVFLNGPSLEERAAARAAQTEAEEARWTGRALRWTVTGAVLTLAGIGGFIAVVVLGFWSIKVILFTGFCLVMGPINFIRGLLAFFGVVVALPND